MAPLRLFVWIALTLPTLSPAAAFAQGAGLADCLKRKLQESPAEDTAQVIRGISARQAQDITTRLEAIARKAFAGADDAPMSDAQFNSAFEGLQEFARTTGIQLTRKTDTVGVFPEGLTEIALSGFDHASETDALHHPTGFAARHELGHLFHALQVRAILIRSFTPASGSLTEATRAQLEGFLSEIEGGTNYLEFEEAVTGLASPMHRLAGPHAQSMGAYRERISKILQGTRQGLLVGRIRFPTDRTFEEVYALCMSRMPLLVGKSIGDLGLRMTPVLFGIFYAQNLDVSRLGIQPPGSREDVTKKRRPYGLRDWVQDLLKTMRR